MKTILVVDDMAIFRDPISACMRQAGYETVCAADGQEALKIIRDRIPDLMLLDMAMPGMNGLKLLQYLKANAKLAKIPVIVLTAMTDKKYVLDVARLGVKDYLLKTRFSLSELMERVGRHLNDEVPAAKSDCDQVPASPSPKNVVMQIPVLLQREQCIQRATEALASKTLSGVASQVVSMAASPRSDTSKIATLISRDPMLSARVLRVANTAAYASQKGVVTTISEAMRNIGLTTVRNIAAAMGIFDAMPEVGPDGFNPIRCWQHSFAVAQICERLQSSVNPDEAGVAYLVGLCHDLGEIIFYTQFATEYRQILDMAQQTGRPRAELEQSMLGITHGELVRTILQHIGLPETILQPVEAMHKAAGRTDPKEPLARILLLADLYANGILLASSVESPIAPLLHTICKLAVDKLESLRPDGTALRGEVMSLTALLGTLSPKEQESLMQPLFMPTKFRIRLVRESIFSSFDPMAAALESVAEVSISKKLPDEQEIGEVDAVVVTACAINSPGLGSGEIESWTRGNEKVPLLWLVMEPPAESHKGRQPINLPASLQTVMNFVQSVKKKNGGVIVPKPVPALA